MSVFSDLLNGVTQLDRKVGAVEYEGVWYSWGQLADAISSVRAALADVGAGKDFRVGVLIRNRPAQLAAVLAVMGGDACLVSINPLYPNDRLAEDVAALQLPIIIGETADLRRQGVMAAITAPGTSVIELLPNLQGAKVHSRGRTAASGAIRTDQPGIIIEMLTSGTTGVPKRIPLKRISFDTSFLGALSYERGRAPDEVAVLRKDVAILSNPLTHIGGLWAAVTCIASGRKACLLEKFSVDSWHRSVKIYRPKVARAAPAALRMILDANLPREDLSSLRAIRTGAAPLDPEVIKEFWERYGIPVLQNYGATEFAGAVAGWTLIDFMKHRESKLESVGRFQKGVEGRIVDPNSGAELSPGEEGVLEMRAAQFGNDGAWLRTTDRAVIDSDGFLFIRGRADNAIIRGGFKVHPDDVVKELEAHPSVREAVVVGLPDRRLGAVPAAVIMTRDSAEPISEEELVAFVRGRLLPYQIPARFLFVDEVPRTPTMKPALPFVRKLFEEPAFDAEG